MHTYIHTLYFFSLNIHAQVYLGHLGISLEIILTLIPIIVYLLSSHQDTFEDTIKEENKEETEAYQSSRQ